MARDFGPFPTKPMYEVVNRRMQRALAEAAVSTGFARSGQGAVTAGTGAELVIAAYPDGALVDGLYVENPASETVTLTTNTNTNPRIDRLVLRLDMAAQTIAPFQIVGTPAASPQIPPLVQTADVCDMPLCRYTMPGSASAQNPASIVDERVSNRVAVPAIVLCTVLSGWSAIPGRAPVVYMDSNGLVHLAGAVRPNAAYNPNDDLPHTPIRLPLGYRPTIATPVSALITTGHFVGGVIGADGGLNFTYSQPASVGASVDHYLDGIAPFHPGYTGGALP